MSVSPTYIGRPSQDRRSQDNSRKEPKGTPVRRDGDAARSYSAGKTGQGDAQDGEDRRAAAGGRERYFREHLRECPLVLVHEVADHYGRAPGDAAASNRAHQRAPSATTGQNKTHRAAQPTVAAAANATIT